MLFSCYMLLQQILGAFTIQYRILLDVWDHTSILKLWVICGSIIGLRTIPCAFSWPELLHLYSLYPRAILTKAVFYRKLKLSWRKLIQPHWKLLVLAWYVSFSNIICSPYCLFLLSNTFSRFLLVYNKRQCNTFSSYFPNSRVIILLTSLAIGNQFQSFLCLLGRTTF